MSERFPAVAWTDDDLIYDLPVIIDQITNTDPEQNNTTRAQVAALALRAFADRVCPGGEETETLIGDLLANLMHLCDAAGLSFDDCLATANMHYDAEILGEL